MNYLQTCQNMYMSGPEKSGDYNLFYSISLTHTRTPTQALTHARTHTLTISLLYRHHVGGGTTLNDGVSHQVATLGHHSYQLRYTYKIN